MIEKEQTVVCDVCGQPGATVQHAARTYGEGENLLVIGHVPVVSCPNCGESYLTADTLHKIEVIKSRRKVMAVERLVAVASFS